MLVMYTECLMYWGHQRWCSSLTHIKPYGKISLYTFRKKTTQFSDIRCCVTKLLGHGTNGQELTHLLFSWNTPQIILPVQATFKLIWPDCIRPKNVIFII